MKNEKQTKIDEFDNKKIIEEKADEKTKTSQMKKLKSISKIINEMIIELEPKPQSKSDESIHKDKSNFGFNLGSKHKESKPGFGFKSPEKKFDFGSKSRENKMNFGSRHTEKKFDFGSKSTGIKTIPVTNLGSKHKESKPGFGSKSMGIKTIPVTSTKLQPAWKPKQE